MHDEEDDQLPETDEDRARSALAAGCPVEAIAWAVLALADQVERVTRKGRR